MVELNTKIQPLVEDLRATLSGDFLTSTEYKRWLVEKDLDETWAQCVAYVKGERRYFMVGFNHDASDAKEALGIILNLIFEHQRKQLPAFILDLLSFFASEKAQYVEVSNIKKDLLAVGYTPDEVSVLDEVFVPTQILKVVEAEQTQEQVIRSLEKSYLEIKSENSQAAIDAYLNWHSQALLYLSQFYTEANSDFAAFKHLDNSGNGYSLRTNYKSIYSVYNLLMNGISSQEIIKVMDNRKKTPMVFISHSHSDEKFVVALVNLLEDMGFTQETLFCSSVREYGVPLSGDICETIRGLFQKHDLYVVFVHSPRFYGSAVSMNEMGAAWVLKSDFCSILTNDMDYSMMKGVVNDAKLSIKVDAKDAPSLLNDMYKHLRCIFSLQQMDMSKWERKRDQFLDVVTKLKSEEMLNVIEENDVDIEYKKLQIEKMKQEAALRQKAIIRGNVVKEHRPGSRTLKIFNAGMALARNVRVEWLNKAEGVLVYSDFSNIGELTPQNSRSYSIALSTSHPETMRLRYTWEDDFSNENKCEEYLQL